MKKQTYKAFLGLMVLQLGIFSSVISYAVTTDSTAMSHEQQLDTSLAKSSSLDSEFSSEANTMRSLENDDTSLAGEESVTKESTVAEESTVRKKRAVEGGTIVVSDWAEFVLELANNSSDPIVVETDLTADPTQTADVAENVTREIDFSGHQLLMGQSSINIPITSSIKISNVHYAGSAESAIFTGDGDLTIIGKINALATNGAALVKMVGGSLTVDGAQVSHHSSSDTPAVNVKHFTVTNGSDMYSDSENFYRVMADASSGGSVRIDGGSIVKTESNYGAKNKKDSGGVWLATQKITFDVEGFGTQLLIRGTTYGTGQDSTIKPRESPRVGVDNGMFTLGGPAGEPRGMVLNVKNGAQMDVDAPNGTAIFISSLGSSFNVEANAQLNVSSGEGQGGGTGRSSIRFYDVGNMAFNISGNSKVNIKKDNGIAAAVRMFGGGNKISVTSGSDFIVRNIGDGIPKDNDPRGNSRNYGVHYAHSNLAEVADDAFILSGEDSNVQITADNGAAISAATTGTSTASKINITAGPGTYFIARGKTESVDSGIFNGPDLQFDMESVKYFDFANTRDGGGKIFTSSIDTTTFTSKLSDTAFWKIGTNQMTGQPTAFYPKLDYRFSGKDLVNLDDSTSEEMKQNFGSITEYSRMSANNQPAFIDQLRIPTDADKSVSGHAKVPEAKYEDARNAFADEVKVELAVKDVDGETVYDKIEAVTADIGVYGDDPVLGTFKAETPDDQFLSKGCTVEVLSAIRGEHESTAADFPAAVTTVDVTPPEPAELERSQVAPGTTSISGTGTPGSIVTVTKNGSDTEPSLSSEVAADGKFTIDLPTDKVNGDTLQIHLRDNAGLAAGVIKPPATNNAVGNINPVTQLAYHDAVFAPAVQLTVIGALELVEVPKLFDFGQQKPSLKTTIFKPEKIKGELKIADTRGSEKAEWTLTLQQTKGLTTVGDDKDLSKTVYYQPRGGEAIEIKTTSAAPIERRILTDDGILTISDDWENGTKGGLFLDVPYIDQRVGEYSGELTWTLGNVR
ncbi:Ig-like domain-containing protein [Vagococcus acidifermentans]|uniref:Bacterial Ig domain-containing protein n=1 Tax=Vagococcus acidifermentans TaxID=564710 RepID=A0A430B2Q9_9ENTE|nr:Ig-like domain-containing protein [Vagococcus acidifermentans]RSU14604.1 hypothetical protein CBF27_01065 [Vagococcus acidifermentans]